MKTKKPIANILIVDDEEMISEAIALQLKSEGYGVVTTFDGYEAIQTIKQKRPDLIISDIAMPHLSGFELLSLVKEKLYTEVPVILISVLDQKEVISTAFKLGVDDFIIKPINMEELSIRVKNLINKS